MNTFPLNYVLMTSTKGHFDVHDRYKTTVESLDKQFTLSSFRQRFASVKVSSESMQYRDEMTAFLASKGFKVSVREGDWKHGDNSHQSGMLQDLLAMFTSDEVNQGEYSLVSEDDFVISCTGQLDKYLYQAIKLLQENQNLVQIRIARFTNEFQRIGEIIKRKHNIDGRVLMKEGYFTSNDWSNNLYVCRTRDLRNALILMLKNPAAFPMHSEHGLGAAMKYFSLSEMPFACLDPQLVRCGHIGTPVGQEDDLTKDLIAT